ncbi:hypothetical protein PHLCEN_2v6024 [Hermanssonia centrifuga]|uniref:Uncharacterized protein n=1 Tax=Hermanssonia centrifuga TaxID=98765 RepID=A0A2R6P181_9APHY|nr:hypothetical protein PHLCEN_2v6024 [Hermanssonia centrifuga]
MVVTRRAPAPPVPTSRTNSSQPVPRIKSKTPQTVPDVPSPLANGASRTELSYGSDKLNQKAGDESESLATKGKSKKGKQKKGHGKNSKGGTSFMELLTRVFLLWFTIYTLTVCPQDDTLKSPVCRGLYEYRRLVLEPYVLPQLQHALAHPVVAPYVDRAKPYVDRVIATAKPAALRAHSEWNSRVVPQWNKTILPQWNKFVVPQWERHAAPHVDHVTQLAQPYISMVKHEYEHKLAPHLRVAAFNLYKWQQQARPYVVLAAHKTYDGYQYTKPYAVPVLHNLQVFLARFTQFLGEQRRQFVDPHVKKIWERVNELSSGEPRPSIDVRDAFIAPVSKASAKLSSVPTSSQSLSPLVPKAPDAVLESASSVLPDVPSESETLPATVPSTNTAATPKSVAPTDVPAEDHASSVPEVGASSISSVSSSLKEDAPSLGSTASLSLTDHTTASAASIVSAGSSVVVQTLVPSASIIVQEPAVTAASLSEGLSSSMSSLGHSASSVYSGVSESVQTAIPEALSTASSISDDVRSSAFSLGSTATDLISEAASAISSSAPSALPSDETEDDDFLAKFYAELGLDQDLLTSEDDTSEEQEVPPAVDTESEEEREEKLRLKKLKTEKKRADITARHSAWEKELEERISLNRKALRKSLVALRKAAVQELKESVEIHKDVEGLVEEAEKYLKGAEKYLGNLSRESRADEEKRIIWERVVQKVDKKFEERLTQTEAVVNGWYLQVIENELQEVRRLVGEVRDIAGRAQADIGLDYAWLDDVTYGDWQRYHDLERRSENFAAQALSIHNGTHPSPPINPVIPALEDLQNEVQDVVVGFETRLRRIKRNGERAFGAAPEADSEADDHELHESASDETVSILPIEDDKHKDVEDGESPAVPPVVIGRSKEEILSALDRAAELEEHATSSPEDKYTEPEHVVESLVEEAVAEGHLSSRAPPREEL